MLSRPVLALEDAKRMAAAAATEARNNHWNVSIAIVDDGGYLIYLERMDAAAKPTAFIATEKARTAALFRRPTASFDEALRAGRNAILGLPGVTPVEGGVPLMAGNECIGAVGVSGVQSTEDAQIARAGAAALVF